jgi:hydroxymethylglutaryl-CoA reductase
MNGQQMIEHLSKAMQLGSGRYTIDYTVSKEKEKKRKPFLDTSQEIQQGFQSPFLLNEGSSLEYKSIPEAIDNLILEINHFVTAFTTESNRTVMHPFFGELDFTYWKKFHTKHFTHHFKQFGLI